MPTNRPRSTASRRPSRPRPPYIDRGARGVRREELVVLSAVSRRSLRRLRLSLYALPERAADEERSQPFQVQRGLLRLPHRLDQRRERIQILADQADDEVVVVLVETVAREADVVCVV